MAEAGSESAASAVTGVVLAGGRSRRMGRDKALLALDGTTLLVLTLRALMATTTEQLVVGREALDGALPSVRCVRDEQPGQGPLGGIATALRAMRTEYAFVAACDMPRLQPALIRFLISIAREADIVVPHSAHGSEGLHAVYSVACLPAIEACLRASERRVSALLDRVRTRVVEPSEWRPYDPEGHSFLNVNTPEEWQALVGR